MLSLPQCFGLLSFSIVSKLRRPILLYPIQNKLRLISIHKFSRQKGQPALYKE